MNTTQVWMEEEVRVAIAKAMENEPEGPDRDYWTTETLLKEIKAKYALKRFKPKPVTVTLVRECCGTRFVHVLTARESAICLKDPECADPECRRRMATLPFGMFKGQTLSWVYEQSPSSTPESSPAAARSSASRCRNSARTGSSSDLPRPPVGHAIA